MPAKRATKKAAGKPIPKRALKTGPIKTGKIAEQLDLVRRICLALPNTYEKLSHSEPTFFAGKRVFTMFSDNHHGDGHIAVWVPAPEGEQARLIRESPKTYFRPAYVGSAGWIGVDLDHVEDDELAAHIHEAHRIIMVAQAKSPSKRR
jgi:hypothetical protein